MAVQRPLARRARRGGIVPVQTAFPAGAGGLYLEDPRIVTWPAGATTGTATTAFAGLVLNIPPNTAEPAGSAAIGEVPMRISLRFTVLDVYRP